MKPQLWSRRYLWVLAWPIAIEMLLQFLMGTADTLMVSRIGDYAVSAVGVSNQILQSAMTLFAVINAGAGIVVAQKWGAGQQDKARAAAMLALKVNIAAGAAVSILFGLGAGSVLEWMHTPGETAAYAVTYLGITGGAMIVVVLHSVMNAVIRSTGNTRGPMYITLGMNGLHLVLNVLLIFGEGGFPAMGIAGAAVSTLVSRSVALIPSVWLLRKSFEGQWRRVDWISQDGPLMKEILRIGLPVSLTAVSWGYSQILIFSLISRMGADSLAAFTYLQTVQQFPWMIASALGGALQIQVSQLYGAGRRADAGKSIGRAVVPGFLLILAAAAAIYGAGTPILRLFTDREPIIAMAKPLLAVCILWQPLRIIAFCLSGSLNAVGEARYVALWSVFGMWVLSAGGAYVLGTAARWGLTGVYTAMIIDEIVRGSGFLLRFRAGGPFAPDPSRSDQEGPGSFL